MNKPKRSAGAAKGSRPAKNRRNSTAGTSLTVPQGLSWMRLRSALPFMAALLMYLITANGLFLLVPEVQTPLLPAILAGLLAASVYEGATSGALALLVGFAVAPPWWLDPALPLWVRILWALGLAAAAGAVAAGVRSIPVRFKSPIVWLVLLLIVANFWVSAIVVDNNPISGASLTSKLQQEPQPFSYHDDGSVYLRIFYLTHQGTGYYQAVRQVWQEHAETPGDPYGVLSYRLPTLFWAWLLLPPDGATLIWPMLVLASIAVLAAYTVPLRIVGEPLSLLAAAGVAAYLLFGATTMYIVFVEFWVIPFGIIAVACFMRSTEGTHSGRWLAGAIAFATLSALMREHMVYLLIAGLVAAGVVRDRRAIIGWLSGIGVFIVAFAAHYAVASQHVATGSSAAAGVGDWLRGGPAWLWATLVFAEDFFALHPWVPLLLIGMAVTGAWLLRDKRQRVFLLVAILGPFTVFLFFANPQLHTATLVGYWGALVVPIALSAGPLAFAKLAPANTLALERMLRDR